MIHILDFTAVLGIVWLLSSSKIFKPLREAISKKSSFIGELSTCYGCLMFYVATIYYFVPRLDLIRFVFTAILIAVIVQMIFNKLK